MVLAQFSLTVQPPPEPATFDTNESFLTALKRPVHVIVILIIHLIVVQLPSLHYLDFVLLSLLASYPLLWLFGVLPPVASLILWGLERVNVVFFGGSPSPSTVYLLISLICSIISASLCFMVHNDMFTLCLSTVSGFLLSIDFETTAKDVQNGSFRRFIVLLVILIVSVINVSIASLIKSIEPIWILYIITVLFILKCFCDRCLRVYLFCGTIRNAIYTRCTNISNFIRFKRVSTVIKKISGINLNLRKF